MYILHSFYYLLTQLFLPCHIQCIGPSTPLLSPLIPLTTLPSPHCHPPSFPSPPYPHPTVIPGIPLPSPHCHPPHSPHHHTVIPDIPPTLTPLLPPYSSLHLPPHPSPIPPSSSPHTPLSPRSNPKAVLNLPSDLFYKINRCGF